MKSTFLSAAVAAAVGICHAQKQGDWGSDSFTVVTTTITNTHYVCPCDPTSSMPVSPYSLPPYPAKDSSTWTIHDHSSGPDFIGSGYTWLDWNTVSPEISSTPSGSWGPSHASTLLTSGSPGTSTMYSRTYPRSSSSPQSSAISPTLRTGTSTTPMVSILTSTSALSSTTPSQIASTSQSEPAIYSRYTSTSVATTLSQSTAPTPFTTSLAPTSTSTTSTDPLDKQISSSTPSSTSVSTSTSTSTSSSSISSISTSTIFAIALISTTTSDSARIPTSTTTSTPAAASFTSFSSSSTTTSITTSSTTTSRPVTTTSASSSPTLTCVGDFITDGGFEEVNDGSLDNLGSVPVAGGGWSISSEAYYDSNLINYDGYNTPYGNKFVAFKGYSTTLPTLSQEIDSLDSTGSTTYVLSFDYDIPLTRVSSFGWCVLTALLTDLSGLEPPLPTTLMTYFGGPLGGWQSYTSDPIFANSISATLSINWDCSALADGEEMDFTIDNVSLTAVSGPCAPAGPSSSSSSTSSLTSSLTTTASTTSSIPTSSALVTTTSSPTVTTTTTTATTITSTAVAIPSATGTCLQQSDQFFVSNGEKFTKYCSTYYFGQTLIKTSPGFTGGYGGCAEACSKNSQCTSFVYQTSPALTCDFWSGPLTNGSPGSARANFDTGILA
ncbi:uncharacterized protein Z519_06968 [Cladophialophora bantiana CBS 173.52]|uniref:Apple domain-containing protein n=1 Tax=Cladophialophora bantiana (strain ATCC 10958 / CBS 173.52 / CDC B-1940 / NIH 8579) TaxID=1442370 RepID=A0A0D2EPW4_CLAB1|nr:uncharacterized protein Z519_06968 [Cladophialophora bantiana CBS 173.52]KIW91986.1 hypothetical protein Z519_06968 [Cladophialophora bantiana CBS 173.52]